jgi:hypothetical protein
LRAFVLGALLVLWAGSCLASGSVPDAESGRAYPADLDRDHWAYPIARDLARRGILKGFPDGTFRGTAPINRFQLAIALDRALATLSEQQEPSPRAAPGAGDRTADAQAGGINLRRARERLRRRARIDGAEDADDDDEDWTTDDPKNGYPEIRSASDPGPALTPGDAKALAKLTREFARELSTLRLRTAGLEERQKVQRRDVDQLKVRVDRIAERIRKDDNFRFRSGELRLVGFSAAELRSFTNLILNFDYRITDRITGVFSPQLFNQFDRSIADSLDIWEAYADFSDYGFVNNLRAGRQLMLVGAGLTLFNRVEAFNFSGSYADWNMQVLFLGDLMLIAEGRTNTDQAYGFYYIEQSRNGFNTRPLHLGAYVKGKIGNKLAVGAEYANYSNRISTPVNRDVYTQGYLADIIWEPSPKFRWRQAAIAAEEDFRALSIDRDLAFHSPVSSPLEDVLQALSQASRVSPTPSDRNEINGFWDLKTSMEFALPYSRFRMGLDWDRVRDFSTFFNNARNGFDVLGLRFRRPVSEGSFMEFRIRRLDFEHSDPDERVGTLDLPRIDRSDVRVQWFGRF